LKASPTRDLDVYYDYVVDTGISAERALHWRDELRGATEGIPHYRATNWIPRELLLCMLSTLSADDLLRIGPTVRECGGLPTSALLAEFTTLSDPGADSERPLLINRVNGRVLELGQSAARLLEACLDSDVDVATLGQLGPAVFDSLAHFPAAREVDSPLQRDFAELAV
jgi:anaerobic magnesium-protoporphyrin IX monomethyl ester cyclase